MIEIVPTVVPESLQDIVDTVNRYTSFATRIHVDVADGVFAPNTTWMPGEGEMLPEGMEYEIHMMVADPHAIGLQYAKAGAHSLIGHVEAFDGAENAARAYEAWRTAGISEVQAAALFQTRVEDLAAYVPISDLILLMTIASIGVQGIPFEEEGITRIQKFHDMYPDARIAVDGGVSMKNIDRLVEAGARHCCVGSAISRTEDPAKAYQDLLALGNTAL
ncbi:MAG: hypothetical protein AAB440_00765 [Patescibacteria group bacterium]